MSNTPKFELVEAHITAAAKTYKLLGGAVPMGEVLWEVLEANRFFDPNALALSNDGLRLFMDMRSSAEERIVD